MILLIASSWEIFVPKYPLKRATRSPAYDLSIEMAKIWACVQATHGCTKNQLCSGGFVSRARGWVATVYFKKSCVLELFLEKDHFLRYLDCAKTIFKEGFPLISANIICDPSSTIKFLFIIGVCTSDVL